MTGIMMLADPSWCAFHTRNSVGDLAVFYASPHKKTRRGHLDPLFCVRPGQTPRSIVAMGRIRAQTVIHQDAAWAKYGRSLGAESEAEWRNQASAVLENSRVTFGGEILGIELVDFQTFLPPVLPSVVGMVDTGWSDKKAVDEVGTARLLRLLKRSHEHLIETPATTELKRQFSELWNGGAPQTPDALRQVQRVIKMYERPSPITRFVKRTRGTTCQLCGDPGFVKRTGGRFCEVHHLFQLSKNPPANCLAPEFLVVLCANCHRRMHYADVGEPTRDGSGWRIRVDGREYHFTTAEPSEARLPKRSGHPNN